MSFQRICAIEELAPGEARKIEASEPVALFNVGGEFFAIGDTCSHGKWSLAEGYVDGDIVECSLHMGQFCIRNGKAVKLPVTAAVKTYPVRIAQGAVEVDVDAGAYSK